MELDPTQISKLSSQAVDSQRTPSADQAAIRKMASEFEALLLNQLTASMNPSQDEEEGGLFSNSGGLGLSRQLFSEQLARTISESGGIGLADLIMSQVNRNQPTKPARPQLNDVAREITRAAKAPSTVTEPRQGSIQLDSAPAQPTQGRFIASDAALATRPRRVHPAKINLSTPPIDTPRPLPAMRSTHLNDTVATVSLQLPTRGVIRSGFGPRRDPINGRNRLHQGIDIAAPMGAPIHAAAAGTVVFSGRNRGYGNMVMIEHADGRRTLYAHASSLFVEAGTQVAAGQTIAAVGSTGHSTGPHVHFEIRVGNQAVDPLTNMANDFAIARR